MKRVVRQIGFAAIGDNISAKKMARAFTE